MNPLQRLAQFGQSVWYDNIRRDMITSKKLAQMIREDDLKGITSNPTIFDKAISNTEEYDEAIVKLLENDPNLDARALFFSLAIEDIQAAADVLRPVYESSNKLDGYVSLEVSPDLAYDTQSTVKEAKQLWKRVDRPNLMIKVPATAEGVPAVNQLIRQGVNVNATLLFAVHRYQEIIDAYLSGLEARKESGEDLHSVRSVASFFVSRVDSATDKLLASCDKTGDAASLLGKIAIANAKMAYQVFQKEYSGDRFSALKEAGAQQQRLLWASTGVKNPTYSDVLYIETLIGDNTVSTMPPATYDAFRDHGKVAKTLGQDLEQANAYMENLRRFDIDIDKITEKLEKDGVESFKDSFENLLESIQQKRQKLIAPA